MLGFTPIASDPIAATAASGSQPGGGGDGDGSMIGSSMAGISPQKIREFLKSLEPEQPKPPKRKKQNVKTVSAPEFKPAELPALDAAIPSLSLLDRITQESIPQRAQMSAARVSRPYPVGDLREVLKRQAAAGNELAAAMLLLM